MQDRYAGDIGDFGKIALLKELNNQGLSIGVNWYKTDTPEFEKNSDNTYKQNDGKYYEIPDELKQCDSNLAEALSSIVNNNRSIKSLQEAELIPNAVYYDKTISVENRENWHNQALSMFEKSKTDLVFLDPDNGLLVKSVKESSPRSVKYAFYNEVKSYLNKGESVLVYNHRCRKSELKYFNDIKSNLRDCLKDFDNIKILAITFPRGTVRDYFAITNNEEHFAKINAAFSVMLSEKWKGLCQKPLTENISYTEYFARFDSKSAFLRKYQALPENIVRDMINNDDDNTLTKACKYSEWKK